MVSNKDKTHINIYLPLYVCKIKEIIFIFFFISIVHSNTPSEHEVYVNL